MKVLKLWSCFLTRSTWDLGNFWSFISFWPLLDWSLCRRNSHIYYVYLLIGNLFAVMLMITLQVTQLFYLKITSRLVNPDNTGIMLLGFVFKIKWCLLIEFFSIPGCSSLKCLVDHLQGKPVTLKYVKFQNVRRYANIHEHQLLQESFVRWTLIFFTVIEPVWPFLSRTINMMGKLQMFKKLFCMDQRKFLSSYDLIPFAWNLSFASFCC